MTELNSPLSEFAADWLQREPALALCHRFAAQPVHWLASVVLVEELLQAMFALSNQQLAQIKIAWWADEADLAIAGAARHPLTQALFAQHADLRALAKLVRAAQEWITFSTALDANTQRGQFAELAAAASELVNEGDCAAIWTEIALKRQTQSYAKPDRYGSSVLSRAALAEFQLKTSQLSDPALMGAALSAKLTAIGQTLRDALPSQALGLQSATRAYGLLHAREAAAWSKLARAPNFAGFMPGAPSISGLLQAWWIARN